MQISKSTEDWEIQLGEQVRKLRLRDNLDQQTLATQAGIGLSVLNCIEI